MRKRIVRYPKRSFNVDDHSLDQINVRLEIGYRVETMLNPAFKVSMMGNCILVNDPKGKVQARKTTSNNLP
jgi:hypothetical protein